MIACHKGTEGVQTYTLYNRAHTGTDRLDSGKDRVHTVRYNRVHTGIVKVHVVYKYKQCAYKYHRMHTGMTACD